MVRLGDEGGTLSGGTLPCLPNVHREIRRMAHVEVVSSKERILLDFDNNSRRWDRSES
jgi:hypothetical protein